MLRESFMSNFHRPDLNYMSPEEQQFTSKFGRFIHEDNIEEFYDLLSRAIRDLGQNANARIVFFELTLKTIILLRR
jgi:DNA polymerase-3 subunit delta'